MRQIVFVLLFCPVFIGAQINRSATELAKENIQEYITGKVFNGCQYQPLSYGALKDRKDRNPEIVWSIEHSFQITETITTHDKRFAQHKPYKFMFYLNKRMKVMRAETYISED